MAANRGLFVYSAIRHDIEPVHNGGCGMALQVQQAADVGGGNRHGTAVHKRFELSLSQALRERRLQQAIGSGRTTAQVRIRHRRQHEAEFTQYLLNHSAQFLSVLQRTR